MKNQSIEVDNPYTKTKELVEECYDKIHSNEHRWSSNTEGVEIRKAEAILLLEGLISKAMLVSISDLERRRDTMQQHLKSPTLNGAERSEVRQAITQLKAMIKERNKTLAPVSTNMELTMLKQFIKKEFGENCLEKYYNEVWASYLIS